MEGLLVDELDWYQGAGFLDEARLRLATGTHLSPDGYYGIAASDKIELPIAKAVLVSDVINCQVGTAELRFMYWTSPEVRIVVCAKTVARLYPDYDYCAHPIQDGDPGPAYVTIPDLSGQPFQASVFLRAENFVFHTANLQGGFAIIDSIEYYGDFCTKDGAFSHTANSVQENVSGIRSPFLSNDQDPHTSDGRLASAANGTTHSAVPVMAGIRTSVDLASTRARGACLALNCSFDENDCTDYTHGSEWTVSKHPVGNPLTGIRGDASRLPYNSNGSFVYAVGPKAVARFVTRPFSIDKDIYFMFAYHKVSRQATLRVMLKKENEPEKALFEAPRMAIESRRWFREVRPIEAGDYSYIAFEVRDLPAGAYVGIDEMVILDEARESFCHGPRTPVMPSTSLDEPNTPTQALR